MSKMSDLSIEVQELLADGIGHAEIAAKLNIPIEWVEEEAVWFQLENESPDVSLVPYDENWAMPEGYVFVPFTELPESIGMSEISGTNEE